MGVNANCCCSCCCHCRCEGVTRMCSSCALIPTLSDLVGFIWQGSHWTDSGVSNSQIFWILLLSEYSGNAYGIYIYIYSAIGNSVIKQCRKLAFLIKWSILHNFFALLSNLDRRKWFSRLSKCKTSQKENPLVLAYYVEINLKPILNIIYYVAYIHIILFCGILIYQPYYFIIFSIPKCFVNCFNNNVCNFRHNVISSVTGPIGGGKYYTVESNQLMPFLIHSNL